MQAIAAIYKAEQKLKHGASSALRHATPHRVGDLLHLHDPTKDVESDSSDEGEAPPRPRPAAKQHWGILREGVGGSGAAAPAAPRPARRPRSRAETIPSVPHRDVLAVICEYSDGSITLSTSDPQTVAGNRQPDAAPRAHRLCPRRRDAGAGARQGGAGVRGGAAAVHHAASLSR